MGTPLNLAQVDLQMKQRTITLTIANIDEPGKPVPLDEEAIRKLGSIPPVLRHLGHVHGPNLRGIEMRDGEIVVTIDENSDLLGGEPTLVEALADCAQRITENAQCRPPLPLSQVVSNPASLKLLKALSKEGNSSGLRLNMDTACGTVELPCLPPEVFTEPDLKEPSLQKVNSRVIGICRPSRDAHVLLLQNMTLLELPRGLYPLTPPDLVNKILEEDCSFIGLAEPIRGGVLRALPDGTLAGQLRLDPDDRSMGGCSSE